jgi:hypothetical protein
MDTHTQHHIPSFSPHRIDSVGRFEKGGRVEVNPQLFETCVQVVEAMHGAVLIFR